MSKSSFNVNLSPREVFHLVMNEQNADLIHDEFQELGDGRSMGTLVFEKYYMRTSNRAALVVLIDNVQGVTNVRVISTGSSEGVFFKFDWGASANFVDSVENILARYIIS
ncbi:DUF6054 family protein [Paenibacillus sp. N1-5-1-14]|uniref:DUF6054 family protein n=1 Tax=Paenibacillus radicibacter TaxID=2972488 RepID=UPI002158D465|nr:DUF6054 family protein [Paenibacillus radicibacter]MCR8643043.1 DUF6054 family protein [Paenibacillus radicibacter]